MLGIKSGNTTAYSIPSSESPGRAFGSGRLSLCEGPHSQAAEVCEEEGAAQSPSTCAAGRQEVENFCRKSSPGRREKWGESVL